MSVSSVASPTAQTSPEGRSTGSLNYQFRFFSKLRYSANNKHSPNPSSSHLATNLHLTQDLYTQQAAISNPPAAPKTQSLPWISQTFLACVSRHIINQMNSLLKLFSSPPSSLNRGIRRQPTGRPRLMPRRARGKQNNCHLTISVDNKP